MARQRAIGKSNFAITNAAPGFTRGTALLSDQVEYLLTASDFNDIFQNKRKRKIK
jgi:hypothetical protein